MRQLLDFWGTVIAKELRHTVSFVAIDEADCVRIWGKDSDQLT